MTNRLVFFLLIGTMMLGAASPSQKPDYHEYHGNLPRQLRKVAQEIGCEPVPGFYDRPGRVEPPYLYGWLPEYKEQTAVFWCYREMEEEPYLLVFVQDLGYGRKGRVTYTIPSDDYPGGLSLFDTPVRWHYPEDTRRYDPQHVPLDMFVYIDNPKEHGPKGETTKYAPLQESYDAVSTLIYRHEGRWLWLGLE